MNKNIINLSVLTIILCLFNCQSEDDATPENYTDSLIAYYPFNGNAEDVINANNGIVKGALLTDDTKAYVFDGVDDVIEIPHTNSLNFQNDFTISALIKTDEIKTQMIIRKGAQVNGENSSPFNLSLSATKDIAFTIGTENGNTFNQVTRSGYEINTWYLITGVFKDKVMFLYVNGILEGFQEINGDLNLNFSSLLIGTRLSLPSSTFNGIIDDVRIYDAALTEIEISKLLNN